MIVPMPLATGDESGARKTRMASTTETMSVKMLPEFWWTRRLGLFWFACCPEDSAVAVTIDDAAAGAVSLEDAAAGGGSDSDVSMGADSDDGMGVAVVGAAGFTAPQAGRGGKSSPKLASEVLEAGGCLLAAFWVPEEDFFQAAPFPR